MKLTIHDIGYMLVGIAKPWEKNHKIFSQSYWGKHLEYWLHIYVSPDKEVIENNTTYYTKLYCKYTLTKLGSTSKPIRERTMTITSKEDFETFIMEVRSIKELYSL